MISLHSFGVKFCNVKQQEIFGNPHRMTEYTVGIPTEVKTHLVVLQFFFIFLF